MRLYDLPERGFSDANLCPPVVTRVRIASQLIRILNFHICRMTFKKFSSILYRVLQKMSLNVSSNGHKSSDKTVEVVIPLIFISLQVILQFVDVKSNISHCKIDR